MTEGTYILPLGIPHQPVSLNVHLLGMRINTYGDYNKDGWRVPNRSAMPWERNNFRGAFELKSANGNFGIRIEVQQGRNVPY